MDNFSWDSVYCDVCMDSGDPCFACGRGYPECELCGKGSATEYMSTRKMVLCPDCIAKQKISDQRIIDCALGIKSPRKPDLTDTELEDLCGD